MPEGPGAAADCAEAVEISQSILSRTPVKVGRNLPPRAQPGQMGGALYTADLHSQTARTAAIMGLGAAVR